MTEHADKLREPFPTNTIKVKPQSVHEDKGLVTFYVDARIVAERLNTVVGADKWEDAYLVITTDPQAGLPVECRLTVEGVTKVDVGQIAPGVIDDKAWKSSYSDAFKRAAVKFGVGAYLYESPNIWAEIKIGRNGKAQGFTDAGKAQALAAYAKWIGDSAPGTGATQVSTGLGGQGETSRDSSAAPQTTFKDGDFVSPPVDAIGNGYGLAAEIDASPGGKKYAGLQVRDLKPGQLKWFAGLWKPEDGEAWRPRNQAQQLLKRAVTAYMENPGATVQLAEPDENENLGGFDHEDLPF